jgi:hypothetical protein
MKHREERLWEKEEKCPNPNLLGSASKRASTERRKTQRNLFFVFWVRRPSSRVDYTEKWKTKRKKENVPNPNSLGSASRKPSTEKRKA